MKIENRVYDNPELKIRAFKEGDQMILEGYAAVFDVESKLIYENGKAFFEILERGAFSETINNDVYLTFNHSKDKILARTINKTLELKEDETGLFFRANLNNTTSSKDLYEMVERGDVIENSFAFTVDDKGQKWERNADGDPVRHISRISNLFDVSVVTKAAYPQTVVWARGYEEFENLSKELDKIITDFKDTNIESEKELAQILNKIIK